LIYEVENTRKKSFSWDEHKEKLVDLWEGLTKEKLDFKISKRWQDIGFQVNLNLQQALLIFPK